MCDTGGSMGTIHVRVPDESVELVRRLRERIQERVGPNVRVTQATVILEALDRLQEHYKRLDRDKGRER
jgi:hypothetical protein